MIDLHSHILPTGDDGSDNVAEAVALGKLAVAEGVEVLVATPHHRNGWWDAEKEIVERAAAEVQAALEAAGVPLTIHPAQEIRLHDNLLTEIDEERVLYVDQKNRYLLLELPFRTLPREAVTTVREIVCRGLIPIIAHPERNAVIAADYRELLPLVEAGAVTQLTAGSYIGAYGPEAEASAQVLLERGLIDVLASDAHNTIDRPFYWGEVLPRMKADFGSEAVERLLDNSRRVYAGEDIRQEAEGE